MTDTTHKSVPWTVYDHPYWDEGENFGTCGAMNADGVILMCVTLHGASEQECEAELDTVRRIVAAVNFCAGVPNEWLETHKLEDDIDAIYALVSMMEPGESLDAESLFKELGLDE